MIKTMSLVAAVAFALATPATAGSDKLVWGGGKQSVSSYSGKYVPFVIKTLESKRMGGYKWAGVSQGTVENLEKVTLNPSHLAVVQYDIAKHMQGVAIPGSDGKTYDFTVLHSNLGPECLYLVTKNKHYTTFGHVLGNAWDINMATGGEKSGSFGTWQALRTIYPDLGDIEVKHVGGTDRIINSVKRGTTAFGFFVMRPDPNNKVFKAIADANLNLVPVVDFDLEGKYEFKDLKIAHGAFLGFGEARRHTTACTSVALITGNPKNAEGKTVRRVKATIKRMNELDSDDLRKGATEKFTTWSDFVDSFKAVTKDKAKKLMAASQKAAQDAANALKQ